MTKASQNSKECRLQIGEFCCLLQFQDAEYASSVRDYYRGFLSSKTPDLTIEVNIILHPEQVAVPDSLLVSKTVEGRNFDFHHGLLKGSLAAEEKKCRIEVKNALLSGSSVRVFEQFLYQAYYTLLEKKYARIDPNVLLHACAVSRDGLGYVFMGPPGSGKSTIAGLSNNHQVLNDEMVIIGKENGKYYVRSTPFNGLFRNKVNGSAPLKAVFYLRHGDRNYFRPFKPVEFVGLAMREVVVPTPLLSDYSAKDLAEMADFCTDLVSEVPCCELFFVPEEGLWEFIEKDFSPNNSGS